MRKFLMIISIMAFSVVTFSQSEFDLGVKYFNNHQFEKAISTFKSIKNNCIDCDLYDVNFNIGASYTGLKLYDSSIVYFTYAIINDPQEPKGYYGRGSSYYALKSNAKSIEDLRMAIACDSKYYKAYSMLFDEYYELDSLEQARIVVESAMNLFENEEELYMDRGLLNFTEMSYQLAINDFDKVLSINPWRTQAITERAYCYYYTNNYSTAISELGRVKKEYKNDSEYNYRFGMCYMYKPNPELKKSLKYMNKAVKLESSVDSRYYRAIAFKLSGNFDKALEDILFAYVLDSADSHVIYELAYLYYKKEQYPQAQQTIEKINSNNFDNLVVKLLSLLIVTERGGRNEGCNILNEIELEALINSRYFLASDIKKMEQLKENCEN